MSILSTTIKFALGLTIILTSLSCVEKTVIEPSKPIKINQSAKTAKPGAAIKLISNSSISAAAHELIQTEIALEIAEPGGELFIEFFPSQGLSLHNTITPQIIQFEPSAPVKIPVTLMAETNGRYYLNMHIRLKVGDEISARTLAVIVQVGSSVIPSVQLKKSVGENIIVLPAQETISSQ
jgi:hypothetical protein